MPDMNLAQIDHWEARELTLSWPKMLDIWNRLQKNRTLFSDNTKDDFDNYARLILQPNSVWWELVDVRNDEMVGLFWLERIELLTNAYAHIIFFDRKLAEKTRFCKGLMRLIFQEMPLHRLTVETPDFYHATIRFVDKLGFRREGKRREAVLLGGQWKDLLIFGITRSEVEVTCRDFSEKLSSSAPQTSQPQP